MSGQAGNQGRIRAQRKRWEAGIFTKQQLWVRVITQRLREPTAFPEDLRLIASTHMEWCYIYL